MYTLEKEFGISKEAADFLVEQNIRGKKLVGMSQEKMLELGISKEDADKIIDRIKCLKLCDSKENGNSGIVINLEAIQPNHN